MKLVRANRNIRRSDGSWLHETEWAILVADREGEPHLRFLTELGDGIEVVLPHVAAEPGWYALVAILYDGEYALERQPVVAWRPTVDGFRGGALVIGPDDSGEIRPMDAEAPLSSNENIIGFFHCDRLPEPGDLRPWVGDRLLEGPE